MITWTRRGQDSESTESETGLRLLVEKDANGFDFNGHKFATEAEARAFTEAYCASAIIRHRLASRAR